MNLWEDAKEELKRREKSTGVLQSPYETVANSVINKCIFLLRVNVGDGNQKK